MGFDLLETRAKDDVDWMASFTALPEKFTPLQRYLSGTVHAAEREGEPEGSAHWSFRLTPAPKTPPPPDMIASSVKVGGYPGVLDRLAAAWPRTRDGEVTGRAYFLINPAEWKVGFPTPKMSRAKKLAGGHVATLDESVLTWRLEPPIGVVSAITASTLPGSRVHLVEAEGSMKVDFSVALIQEVEEALWQGISKLLERKS